MQRVQKLKDTLFIIAEVRNEMNTFLGKQHCIIDGINGYTYPNDESGRLIWLQMIVGAPMMDQSIDVSLFGIYNQPKDLLTESNLMFIIDILDSMTKPLADFPPIKNKFKHHIDLWRMKLFMAGLNMNFEFNSDPVSPHASLTKIDAEFVIEADAEMQRAIESPSTMTDVFRYGFNTQNALFFHTNPALPSNEAIEECNAIKTCHHV